MAINDIQAYYDQLLNQKKQAKYSALGQQETDANGQLGIIKSKYDTLRQGINNQFTQGKTELDNNKNQGEQDYYNQGNQAVQANTAMRNRMKAWLDANGLGQSYSVVDAMSNADNQLANSTGKVNSDRNGFMKNIADRMAQLTANTNQQIAEAGTNEVSDASKIQQMLAQIQQQRAGLDNGTDSDLLGIEAEKARAINEAKQALEQQAYQERMARISASRSGGSNGPSISEQIQLARFNQDQQDRDQKQQSQKITSDIMNYLNEWASGKAEDQEGRADRSQILSYIDQNAGRLQNYGVDVDNLSNWARNRFKWDRVNGSFRDVSQYLDSKGNLMY